MRIGFFQFVPIFGDVQANIGSISIQLAGGNHINCLESFWGYLKRRLAPKGGIRERLPLYLAEYVWRYNHRSLSLEQQTKNFSNHSLISII